MAKIKKENKQTAAQKSKIKKAALVDVDQPNLYKEIFPY